MELNINRLSSTDYDDILCQWWRDWRWTPPPKDFLPEDGTGGYIVYDDATPVCAGFMYMTNSKVVWCDWIISNINYKDRDKRKAAIRLLIGHITDIAKNSGHRYSYALIQSKPLIEAYKDLGYTEGSKYTSEMIKIL